MYESDMEPGRYAVETAELTKRFGDRAVVDRVDLRVPAGTAFGCLGPNGAGKSTLIRMQLGLTKPTAGSMWLLGYPVPEQRSAALRRVGAMAEEPRFLDQLTGRENLRINAAARDLAAAGRIDAALERAGLAGRAGERVARYFTGMRQRIGVARCLLEERFLEVTRTFEARRRGGGRNRELGADPARRRGLAHQHSRRMTLTGRGRRARQTAVAVNDRKDSHD